MCPVNDFLPFCPVNLGTNLPTQSVYAADANRTDGNQPGIASSKFNNKALRQGTYVVGQLAQMIADHTATDLLDDNQPTKLLAQLNAGFKVLSPVLTSYLSGSGSHNLTYKFFTGSANATAGATYSDGSTTFTVTDTIAAQTELHATGPAAPVSSGTLTKTGGTGDATILFYATRAPLYLRVRMVGGGGSGGGGGSSSASSGSAGNNTTFSTFTAAGGGAGALGTGQGQGGAGGSVTFTGTGIALHGGAGATGGGHNPAGGVNVNHGGGVGGVSAFGGAGQGGATNGGAGSDAEANTGAGGGGGGSSTSGATDVGAGGGGGAGGFIDAMIFSPSSAIAYSVGAQQTSVGSGSGQGGAGGKGASGLVEVTEYYQ